MKNLVEGLLKGQEERRAQIEKGFVVERRSLAEKLIEELRESLIALNCEDMIAVNNATVNKIEIKKGKVVEVVKEKEVIKEVEVNDEKEIEKYKKTAATWQSKYYQVAKELKETQESIKKLEIEIKAATSKKKEDVKVDKKIEKKIVENKKEEKQEVIETTNDELVRLDKYANERRDDVVMHCNSKYYIMSSDKCKEITVIPRNISTKVTDEVVESIERELIDKLGYRYDREVVSPVTVRMDKGYLQGYFARTDAKEGRLVFSKNDFFGGYVVSNMGTYLWSWDGKSDLCAVYHLDKVIVGDHKNKSVTSGTARMVTKEVKEMYKEYLAKVEVEEKAKAEQIARNTAIANEKKAKMAAHNALFENAINAQKEDKAEEKVETPAANNFSDFTNAYLEGF